MNSEQWTSTQLQEDRHLPEFQEGWRSFYDRKTLRDNPYPHSNMEWWRNEAWSKGWQQAQIDDDDDD